MKKPSLLNRMFFAGLCAIVLQSPASAKSLNLVSTDPDHPIQTIDDKRYVFAKKDDQVTFKATTDSSVYSLMWTFENGTPGTGSADGPHSVTYGENAVGKVSVVKFTTKRYDEDDNHCVTENKRTCAVIIPQIEYTYNGGANQSWTSWKITEQEGVDYTMWVGALKGDEVSLRAKFPGGLSVPASKVSWEGEKDEDGLTVDFTLSNQGVGLEELLIEDHACSFAFLIVADVPGPGQLEVFAKYPDEGLYIATYHIPEAHSTFGTTDNTIDNAKKHAYISALMKRDFGETVSYKFGTAHEYDQLQDAHNQIAMDMWNNSIGRSLADPNSTNQVLVQRINQTSSQGGLRYLDDSNNSGKNSLLKKTNN